MNTAGVFDGDEADDRNHESSSSSSTDEQQEVFPDLNDLYEMTELCNRQRLQNLSLFQLTAENICNNREHFCSVFDSQGINLFKGIPKTLRFELIKTFKFYVGAEENYKFLLLLMNDQVTSVDFGHHIPEIVSDEATEINADFWLAMAIKCPNMKKIRQCLEKDDSEYPTSFDYRWRKKQYSPLANSMSSTAHHFSQLQVLEMPNARCSDYRLEMLAENLPKLRVLQTDLYPKSTSGIAALAKMEELQEFIFVNKKEQWLDAVDNDDAFHYNLCLRILPHLKICGNKKSFELHFYDFPGDLFWPDDATEGHLPSQLLLQQLCVDHIFDMNYLDMSTVALPNLQTLYLRNPTIGFRFSQVLPLPSLTELALYKIEEVDLEPILTVIGHQLHKLSLYGVHGTLHLDMVFRMCPNLQVLYFSSEAICDKSFVNLPGPLEDGALSGLTEFGYVTHMCGSRQSFKAEDLLQILQAAPNLRILRLYYFAFSFEDGMEICSALEQHSVLQKLEKLCFCCDCVFPNEDYSGDTIYEDCYSVLGCMIRLCPKLVDVKRMDYRR